MATPLLVSEGEEVVEEGEEVGLGEGEEEGVGEGVGTRGGIGEGKVKSVQKIYPYDPLVQLFSQLLFMCSPHEPPSTQGVYSSQILLHMISMLSTCLHKI